MYTIKEISQKINLPASTIRYYDKEGLLPFVQRAESGYRLFSDRDLGLLRMIECLKSTGMSIKDIKQFCSWIQMGDASLDQRLAMFHERRKVVQDQIAKMEQTLATIEYKCWYYETAVAAGTEAIHKK